MSIDVIDELFENFWIFTRMYKSNMYIGEGDIQNISTVLNIRAYSSNCGTNKNSPNIISNVIHVF